MGIFFGPGSPRDDARKLRMLREAEAQSRKTQQIRSASLLDQARGGQPGPLRPNLLDRETGLSLPLAGQPVADQNQILAGLLQEPGLSGQTAAAVGQELFPERGGGGTVGNPSPKDFTIPSIAEFAQSGDHAVLKRYTDPLALQRVNQGKDRLNLQQFLAKRPAPATIDRYVKTQQKLDAYGILQQRAQPEFFGFKLDTVASAAQEINRRFGGESAQAFNDWWLRLETQDALVRKELFGSQFTPGEQKVWNRLTIRPSDSWPTAARKMQTRMDMVREAQQREDNVLSSFGFDMGFEELPTTDEPAATAEPDFEF